MGVQEKVDAKIKENKVMVFSKSYCPYCTKAKSALNKSGIKFELWELDGDSDCGEIQTYLSKLTGASSVPRVFINGKCIGGGDETAQLAKSGQLVKLVNGD